jgi:hypothetical protein
MLYYGRFLALSTILDCMVVANTLAYYDSATITAVKSFKYSAQGDKAEARVKQVSIVQ